ncbi:aminotransferase class IV [Clostridium nigeriense]|uniref:aminotransferase class IV n=1 Tax=Clostridium nigeriense TaxID=1805470 RepID=UPI003D352191
MRDIIFNDNKINLDSGYFFGRGVFETILIKDKPIFLNEHISRLNEGIKILNIGEKVNQEDILKIINKYDIKYCGLKIVVTERNIVLEKRDIPYKAEDYLKGFALKISNLNRSSKSKISYIKSINYLENILEREEALKNGYNEVLFLNENGYLSEGSMSNIFIVKGEKVYTPSIKCGLLPGIVRNFLIREYKIIEKELTIEDVMMADEIFITNSLLGIMGISKFENKILTENKTTTMLRKEYEARIEI